MRADAEGIREDAGCKRTDVRRETRRSEEAYATPAQNTRLLRARDTTSRTYACGHTAHACTHTHTPYSRTRIQDLPHPIQDHTAGIRVSRYRGGWLTSYRRGSVIAEGELYDARGMHA
eukprot:1526464-Rhodomonas_salina.2